MNPIEFRGQVGRLIKRFNPKAFDEEFNELLWKTVCDLDHEWFAKLVDNFIGNSRHPPLLNDFREPAYKERQRKFGKVVTESSERWESGQFTGLKNYLDSIGAVNLANAVEQERWDLENNNSSKGTP